MRDHRGALLLFAAALWVVPAYASAQTAPPNSGSPNPDPAGIDVQKPHPRVLLTIGLAGSDEYRDRLLSDRTTASASASIAWKGFSLSGWAAQELSTDRSAYELMAGYSHKLPFVDAHAALVSCGNQRLPGGCADGVRFTLTSNSIARTMIEASFDRALRSSRRTFSGSVTHDLWKADGFSGAGRISWTRTDYGDSAHLDGLSLRLIAARRISEHLELDFAAGPVWTSGRMKPPSARDGLVAATTLVWRY